jgi:hypothetical protein
VAETFEDIWRAVHAHSPLAPPLLCQDWVRQAYKDLCDHNPWSWLRSEAEMNTAASHAGTVTVTKNSTSVVGGTMTFVAGDQDRQFQIPKGPVYSIVSVNVGTNTATLERAYGGVTATTIGTVFDAYQTMPEDFQRFLYVMDMANGRFIAHFMTEDELNARDPQRASTGFPYILASKKIPSAGTYAGRIQYELWPYLLAAATYPYMYIRRPEVLSDATTFKGPLAHHADILKIGALKYCCEWPGTEERRNPYFNQGLRTFKQQDWDKQMANLERLDDEIYPEWLESISRINRGAPFPVDSNYIQTHDTSAW